MENKLILEHPLKPVKYVNQFFGENLNEFYKQLGMNGHNGIDFYALDSTPVYASHDGVVVFAGEDGGGGLGVVIRTNREYIYNDTEAFYKTIYWHLKTGSIKVHASQEVKAGDLIGLADNTGMSSGSHLHFGLKPVFKGENDWTWFNADQNNGYLGAIDPKPYFREKLIKQFNTSMQYGDSGLEVEKLQKFLIKIGKLAELKHGTKYGYYGNLTKKAVFEFQKENWKLNPIELLYAGKYVGRKTLEALNAKDV